MMKILIVSQYFYPEQFRINDVCFELVRRGHSVTVLTGLPNYPEGKIYPGYENMGGTVETINGATIVRCKLRPRYKGTKNLVLNYLSFVRQANKCIKYLDKDFDVVYVYGVSPITQAYPALKYKKRINKRAKVIYYCCDLWPEAVRGAQNGHKRMSIHNPVFIISKWISSHVYNSMDLICLKCNDFGEYLQKMFKISNDKMPVLFEHAENIYLTVQEKPYNNGIIDFYFLGNIGTIQNCELIVDAVTYLADLKSSFKVHFVGNGSNLTSLVKKVKDLKLDDVIVFHPICPVKDVISHYNVADVCLLTLSNETATGLTPPAKLVSYMASCRPIIASIDGSSQTMIKNANCGLFVNANDCIGLSNLMRTAVINQGLLEQLGKNGRIYFKENLTLEKHVDKLLLFMKEY